jgi:KaiC/GvpD/RAD55 family RecA-like ATPase
VQKLTAFSRLDQQAKRISPSGGSRHSGADRRFYLGGNMLCRLIPPKWLQAKVLEGEFSNEEITKYNQAGYGIYYFPNHPSDYQGDSIIAGSDIDVFNVCFVDYDVKSQKYASKNEFIEAVGISGITPSSVVDSGNGIHVYWKVTGLDAKSYLRLTRRLMRLYNTDPAVGQILQLMRLPGTQNTKIKGAYVNCEQLYSSDVQYTCEELDRLLPPISIEDEQHCVQHYDKTYNINQDIDISEELPAKFGELLTKNKEAKNLWAGETEDRSKADYRLGHLMYANNFTKTEALSVLINTAKALQRAPVHRKNYALGIVNKIWTFESNPINLSESDTVKDILQRGVDTLKGTRFPCNKIIDDTVHGFRLGQVLGIIGGSGVGKTTLTLNSFLWFAEANPDFHHFFFSLEQPPEEIADRIKTICDGNDRLYDKIHIISNYEADGTYRHFSMDSVEEHLLKFKVTGLQVGAVVVDHIGVLSKNDKNGESEGLMKICRKMKAVAVKVNCMLVMLSQAPREKAGVGDLELNKDAAFGTVFFESFVDYCLCLWQPLKRVYKDGAPTIMAFKFAKIRHKKQGKDRIQEDTCYQLFFDPLTERLRELTEDEEKSAKFFMNQAITARKRDRKTDVIPYESRHVESKDESRTDSH